MIAKLEFLVQWGEHYATLMIHFRSRFRSTIHAVRYTPRSLKASEPPLDPAGLFQNRLSLLSLRRDRSIGFSLELPPDMSLVGPVPNSDVTFCSMSNLGKSTLVSLSTNTE